MIQTQQELATELNMEPNQCDYCDSTPCVLYVFASNDTELTEFKLCLPCRNYIVLRMKVLIENKKAQMRENEKRKRQLTKGVKRSDKETRRYPQGDLIE